tara:strand:- start:494 stop:640 length:147 start_codon:yes stop_codon:yes gene_type:complete
MEWKAILKEDKGVGDTISRLTKSIGIKECGGCKKRKAMLNRRFKYEDY